MSSMTLFKIFSCSVRTSSLPFVVKPVNLSTFRLSSAARTFSNTNKQYRRALEPCSSSSSSRTVLLPPNICGYALHSNGTNLIMSSQSLHNNRKSLPRSLYSTTAQPPSPTNEKDTGKEDVGAKESTNTTTTSSNVTVSRKDKLKKAVKDYGATVIVFHVTMSLCSLGFFYLLVSSGLDVVSLLEKAGVGQSILESKITQGASTFVVAYAVHKVFAPVRITITLTSVPFIVKYLRNIGILKKPIK